VVIQAEAKPVIEPTVIVDKQAKPVKVQESSEGMVDAYQIRAALAIGVDRGHLFDEDVQNKLKRIVEAASMEVQSSDLEEVTWAIKELMLKTGSPQIGETKLDQLYRYARLLMDRNQINLQIAQEERGSGSPSYMNGTGLLPRSTPQKQQPSSDGTSIEIIRLNRQ